MQTADNIKPCYPLFRDDDYKKNLTEKRELFEEGHGPEKVWETFVWTTTKEYQDLNFKREALTVDPAKACQPLGAVLAASGFHKTLPYVHGSQGCVAYFRTYFNRHFKEPCSCVSDSMTEDAAVFGGQKNMIDGLENAKAIYKPDMIAVSTTCMAEVIGDDLNAFINNTKKAGNIPQEYPVPYAHTPSFVGSHTTGWDNMEEGILRYFTLNFMDGKKVGSNGKINIVPGFETYLGNYRVIKRMLKEMDVDYTMLSDPSEVFDTPADGEFRMYSGGTTMDEVKDAPNAITTVLLQPGQLEKTKKFVENTWNHDIPKLNIPMGVEWTDEFLMKVSEVTGKPIPESLAWFPTATPGCTARSSPSTVIRTSSWASSRSCSKWVPSRPTSWRTTATSVGPRAWKSSSPPARSVRWARSTPATTCGTCAACASRTSRTS